MTNVEVGITVVDAFNDLSGMPGSFYPGVTAPGDYEMDIDIIVWVE